MRRAWRRAFEPPLRPAATHPCQGEDSTRRVFVRDKDAEETHWELPAPWTLRLPCNPAPEASWMNNSDCFDSIFIISDYDERPPEWNSGFAAISPAFLIITCSSLTGRSLFCRETFQFSRTTGVFRLMYNPVPLFSVWFCFFIRLLKLSQNVRGR